MNKDELNMLDYAGMHVSYDDYSVKSLHAEILTEKEVDR